MLRQALVFCALLATALAFLEIAPLDPIPHKFKDQKGCYIKELDTMIAFDKAIPSKERCVAYVCSTSQVTITGCGVVDAKPPCVVVEEIRKPFPACCPTIKCPGRVL